MIPAKVQKAMNEQIAKEYFSGWLYMQMAAWFEKENLKGFAHWLRIQAQEEACHGLIFFNHICGRGGDVALGQISAPGAKFHSALDIFEKGLAHEYLVTASINGIMEAAIATKDFASQSMLKWFVDEQVEEEANFDEIRSKLARLKKDDGNGLMVLDKELSVRVFVMPAPLAAGAAAAP